MPESPELSNSASGTVTVRNLVVKQSSAEVTLGTIARTPSSMLFGGERVCEKLRLGESPVVLERRNHVAHFGNSRHLDAGADDADIFSGVGEHLTPRIDD